MSLFSDATGINVDPGKGQVSANPLGLIGTKLGGIPGGIAGNFISNLTGGDSPSPNIPEPDQSTKDFQNFQKYQSETGAKGYSEKLMRGTDVAKGMLGPVSQVGLGGDASRMASANSEALNRKANNVFLKNMSKLGNSADFRGILKEMDAVNKTNKAQIDLANLKNNIDTRVNEAQMKMDEARATVLSSIVGAGAQIGAAALRNSERQQIMSQQYTQTPMFNGGNNFSSSNDLKMPEIGSSAGYGG